MRVIRKAVITAAGKRQRHLALQTLVDQEGVSKSALRIVLDEAVNAGAEEIAVVVVPGDQSAYSEAVGDISVRIHFIEQSQPLGYGHALFCARQFVGNEAFLHLVGDHLYVSGVARSCARQLVEVAQAENCVISAVQATRERMLPHYGTVGGKLVGGYTGLYQIDRVIEKPTPTEAEQELVVPGLRAGHYLCFFGIHVLTPLIFDILGEAIAVADERDGVQLSLALSRLAGRERYLAYEVVGKRYDIADKYGLFIAQLAVALEGKDRSEILTQLVELLSQRSR